jgi:hypothetical protein
MNVKLIAILTGQPSEDSSTLAANRYRFDITLCYKTRTAFRERSRHRESPPKIPLPQLSTTKIWCKVCCTRRSFSFPTASVLPQITFFVSIDPLPIIYRFDIQLYLVSQASSPTLLLLLGKQVGQSTLSFDDTSTAGRHRSIRVPRLLDSY